MKKHLAVLAATAVLGVTSAFAANPFSDVTPQDWAYQAVAQLASQGIVNGYPDGTFKGQQNITRYEMAQMVAKALVRQDRVDAEQNAIINRLANEFSAELNNLGVRVSTLENKVGNFKFTGDARLKYTGNEKVVNTVSLDKDGNPKLDQSKKSKFDYRGRVQFAATVNENTKAVVRLVGSKEFGAAGTPEAKIDRVYVQHNFGKQLTATAGRHDLFIGGGLTYDDVLEGATAVVGKDALNASVSYGYAEELGLKYAVGELESVPFSSVLKGSLYKADQKDNAQLAVFQVNSKLGKDVKVGAFYTKVNAGTFGELSDKTVFVGAVKEAALEDKKLDFYGFNANVKLGSKVAVDGEFAKFKDVSNSHAWTAGLTFGNYNMKKQGTWSLRAQYTDLDVFAPVFSSTFWAPANQNYKAWSVQGKYAVANNVGLAAYTTIDAKDQDNNKVSNFYRAELNYKF